MKFSEAFIQKVIEANDVVEIISQHTQLKPSGSGLMGRCPFPDHPEKTASFSVSPSRQVYHCFGCQKSGNVITFLKDFNGLSFRDTIEYLANRAQIELPRADSAQSDDGFRESQTMKELLLKANTLASDLYHYQLKTAAPDSLISDYLRQRHLSPESIELFQLGYANENWDTLVLALAQSKISPSVSTKGELIRRKNEGGGYYDFFRSRLMFPIQNNLGQVIAFGGRVLDGGQPKYLNSPETPVFQKSKTLYGLYQAARHIRTQDYAILVEGYMDVIALHQAGLPVAVAPMGTALTPDQARILARSTRNIVVLFDGDLAGQNAAIRSLPILFQAGLLPKGLFLPEGLDPDDFIQKFGVGSLKSLLDKAPDLFTSLLQNWLIDYKGTATEKIQWTEKLSPILQAIPNHKLRHLYQNEASWKLGLPEDWWGPKYKPTPVIKPRAAENASGTQAHMSGDPAEDPSGLDSQNHAVFDLTKIGPHDKSAIQIMMNNPSCWAMGWKLDVPSLLQPQARELLQKAQDLSRQSGMNFASLISLLTAYVKTPGTLFMDGALQKFYEAEGEETLVRYFTDLVKKLQDRFIASRIEDINSQLKLNPSANLFSKLNDLVKLRQSLQKIEVAPLKVN